MEKQKQTPIIYLAQLELTKLAREREYLRQKLELLKAVPHDKQEYKRIKKEITAKMNALTYDMDGQIAEVYKQNYRVVRMMLMMFVGMDFVTRLYDEAADTFKEVSVGIKRDELLDFTKLCREVATKANEVVRIIDETGKDMMSMAYAEMEGNFGEDILVSLRHYVDTYSTTAAGRKYFYGDNLK